MKKVGSVTIVGAGISGIQTALDIANADFKVVLVEEKPSVGGVMAQLDKTFPTNDCASCMMGPKLVELANHPNIEILAYTDFLDLAGEPGRFTVSVKKKARYVDPKRCVGCGICAEKCPSKVPDGFNFGLNQRKAIYVPYPQAVPLVYTIDKRHCRYFLKGKCGICQKFCKNKAIDYEQKDEIHTFETGALILAGGFTPFDAAQKGAYGYGMWPNVVTSLEYERILSAAGPFQGHIQRISDGKSPRKIAWIQCVGSRDRHLGKDYCSAVCCMYATKQAMITKEHEGDVDTAIFTIDIRAQGKGFDRFYERSKSENDVRYVRSMISRVIPNPGDDTLEISYVTPGHEIREESFDMVVLSVGLCPNPSAVAAAGLLGLKTDEHGFIATDPLDGAATSREGVYVCGAIQGPKDIPDSVQQGSSAAARATALLADARGTLVAAPVLPPERDVTAEPPRIGVFICHCGINIAGVVDVAAVAEYAQRLDGVEYATHCMFACSTDMQQEIGRVIEEKGLNRILVASCTPRTHEPLFRSTLQKAGLNPYLFELANIREQDAWVHQAAPGEATEKAKDLVRMSVSRARLLHPLQDTGYPVVQRALVVGGGLAGLTAALTTAAQGFPAVIVERSARLGGNARTLHYTEAGASPSAHVSALIDAAQAHPLITVHREAEVKAITGACGNFTTLLSVAGADLEVRHGVVFVATGGEEYRPEEYGYGQSPRVMTQREFERLLSTEPQRAAGIGSVVMIQCVGSREPGHLYCSRVCCTAAVKNSLKLKSLNPSAAISVLYRDIRTFGLKESYYTEARRQGVRFYRFDAEQKPGVTRTGDALAVRFTDQQLQAEVLLKPELVVLGAAIRPRPEGRRFAEVARLPLDEDGFFMEAHIKLRPIDVASAGFYLCGLAHGPKFAAESIAQAQGAVCRALAVLSKRELKAEAVITHVDEALCRGCGECERACPFEAVSVREMELRRRAVVNEALCTGCGACNAACPTGAAALAHFQDAQVNAMIEAFM